MSREIKFRIWDNPTNKMYFDVLVGNCKRESTCPCVFIDGKGWVHTDNCVIEQFTGLHDDSEDEKEVYENDIAFVNYGIDKIKAIVKFERGTFILVSDEFIDGYIPLFEVSESDREYEWINGIIIGNIHERSEDDDK